MRFLKNPSPRHPRRSKAREESQEEAIRRQGEDAAKKLHDLIPMEEARGDGTPIDIFEDRKDYIRALGLATMKVERFTDAVDVVGKLLDVEPGLAALRPGLAEYARALAQRLGEIADLGRHDPKRGELELMHLFRRAGPLRWAKKCLKHKLLLPPPSVDRSPIDSSPIDRAYFSFRFAQERLGELVELLKDRSKEDALDAIRMQSPWLAKHIDAHPRRLKLLDFLTGEEEPYELGAAGNIACWVAAELGAKEAGLMGSGVRPVLNFLTNYALRENPARRGRKQKARKGSESYESDPMNASA